MMTVIEPVFIRILNMSLTAGLTVCIVLLMRLFLRRMPKVFSYALWSVVLFRLLCPVSFSSVLSVFNILHVPSTQQGQIAYIPENIGYMENPAVAFPIPAAEEGINAVLPAAETAASVNPMQMVLWAGTCIWLSGIIIMILYGVISYGKLRRKLELAVWVQENIYQTIEIDTPFVCGFPMPRIYLPARFCKNGLSEQEAKEKNYILLHERIHIKRRDYLWRLISYFALCIHWFNPFVWLAFFLSGKDMEMACDEAVVRTLGIDVKKEYSASLLSIASGRRIRLTTPLAFGEGETGSRIKNVLRYKKPAQAVIGIALIACIIVIAVLAANPKNADGASDADSLATDEDSGEVFYGVVGYVNIGEEEAAVDGIKVVTIPGIGEVEIPSADEVYPYIEIENFTGPETGDLLAITFPAGQEVFIQETYPATFSVPAQSIVVMGQGFELVREDSGNYIFTVPWGYAREAKEGDVLSIYYYNDIPADGGEEVLLAETEVISVDADNYDIWVMLTTEEVKTFLANFGHGIECKIAAGGTNQSGDGENQQTGNEQTAVDGLTEADALTGAPNRLEIGMFTDGVPGDGIYRVYVRSLSQSAKGIERYLIDGAEDMEEMPFLAFSENCKFKVNREMETIRYEEVSFDEFTKLAQETFFYLNPPMLLTFHDGMIVEAVLEDYYGAGISYAALFPDMWYGDEEVMQQLTAQEVLDANYTFAHQIYLDVADSEGMERIEVYAANSGDNGIVLVKSEEREDLFTSVYAAGANTSRAGWNNIYLGYMEEYGFMMTLHIENRIDFGEYDYHVFRLSETGEAEQIAGSSFTFDNRGIPYDDELFAEWADNLGKYLAKSELVLSTQDGALRTEMVSEADKYTYETLRPD